MAATAKATRPQGKITITLESEEKKFSFSNDPNPGDDPQVDVTFDSTPEEILDAVQEPVLEQFGINIKEGDEFIYVVKKIESSGNVFIFPKSPAGSKIGA